MAEEDEDLSDWERCFLWLSRCQVLYEQVDSVHSLAAILRDGVVLCHLINQLRSNTIAAKNFSQRPQLSQVLTRSYFLFYYKLIYNTL